MSANEKSIGRRLGGRLKKLVIGGRLGWVVCVCGAGAPPFWQWNSTLRSQAEGEGVYTMLSSDKKAISVSRDEDEGILN